jgi:DMSO/TMAO reductase YedYZ heme-binding membrane subunit
MDISFLDISSSLGLIAMLLLTINIGLGMLLSTGYKKHAFWKKLPKQIQQISVKDIHNWSAYLALVLIGFHVSLLIGDRSSKFTFTTIFWPAHAPHQKTGVIFGTISLYAILIVLITTQKVVKKKMSFRSWKNIHFLAYISTLCFIVHGLIMDPLLKDRPTDWLDGEKVLVEICALLLIAMLFLRIKASSVK